MSSPSLKVNSFYSIFHPRRRMLHSGPNDESIIAIFLNISPKSLFEIYRFLQWRFGRVAQLTSGRSVALTNGPSIGGQRNGKKPFIKAPRR
ncbi:hypothetical protein CEXT_412461 [Caerostris extrusa]|uniref:Uncharacterized protein n=1 Tax=Caerostris extrusa TaxID=172846 RepID=A0AAV4T125_CAEEX|nr:hypothetical protein CEXT_412461 [Caerostris extrusa]